MRPFFFHIEVTPHADNLSARDLGGGVVNIWVFDDSISSAKQRAIQYINGYGWAIAEVEFAAEPTPEQIAQLDEIESDNYKKAELFGISAVFDVWPKESVAFCRN